VQAEPDATRDGTVLTLTVSGPEASTAGGLCAARLARLVAVTHEAFAANQKESTERSTGAARAAEVLQKAGASTEPASAAAFAHWADDLSAARRQVDREVLLTRDSEILDPPHTVDSNARQLLVAALGAFAGLLLGLAITGRSVP
jgi:hypothetical protein